MNEYNIVIIGGGPMCTYALERLAALLPKAELSKRLRVSVFERTGRFGAGEPHSDIQPTTSYMNRIAGQIALAADESNLESSQLLPKAMRPTFYEWCRAKYAETGENQFDLQPRDVPRRYLHGLALRDMFQRYISHLRAARGISVDLYAAEVTDVVRQFDGEAPYRIRVGAPFEFALPAHHILFVTGHSWNHPRPESTAAKLADHARNRPAARYIPYAYPLEDHVTEEAVPPGSIVGVRGLGLTAIDVFLHLTEGRGGAFVPIGTPGPVAKLRYLKSGREPALMVGFSPSGMLTSCRPQNAKEGDVTLEHKAVFFTIAAIRSLRETFGVGSNVAGGRHRRQLDFERHVFPLVVLEMAYVYYKTLFGSEFGEYVRACAGPQYQQFLREGCRSRDDGVEHLLEPVQSCFDDAATYLGHAMRGEPIPGELRRFEGMDVLPAFLATLGVRRREPADAGGVGAPWTRGDPGASSSPWGHSSDIHEHRFNWRLILDPLSPEDAASGQEWRDKVIAYMEKDHADAAQNNLQNPVKAACDGVWRDLRTVFSEAVDRGGLSADSHRRFISVYLRYYNRLSNGAGLEPMKKVLALIECGLLDMAIGPCATIEPSYGDRPFRIRGPRTGVVREVDGVVEGRLHPFDPERDANPLYPNILRRGLVRKWRNPGEPPLEDFLPGALDLSDDYHPVQQDGEIDTRLTFLGAPVNGMMFFRSSAARPYANSYILNDVARWAHELLAAISESDRRSPGDRARGAGTRGGRDSRDTAGSGVPSRFPSTPSGNEPISPEVPQSISITASRDRIASIVEREANASRSRHVVILGIDGITHDLAIRSWKLARTTRMESVFPTTSSTAWLSSLSGMGVDAHGVPGVVFKVPDRGGELINAFEYSGQIPGPEMENIFTDAMRLGYVPVSILGDLGDYDCTWRGMLLRHSLQVDGHRFYTSTSRGEAPLDASSLCRRIRLAIREALQCHSRESPCLAWCFIDADRHIHNYGYDDHICSFMELIEQAALELSQAGAVVVAHSDHGLTRTVHATGIEQLLSRLEAVYRCDVGGAGRTRWIYPRPGTEGRLIDELARQLPESVRIGHAADHFPEGSLARCRVGEIVLVAQGEEFLSSPGFRFDHGSWTDQEVYVPFAEWQY
jgi:hypothetical protein